jgi:hypothetical protein
MNSKTVTVYTYNKTVPVMLDDRDVEIKRWEKKKLKGQEQKNNEQLKFLMPNQMSSARSPIPGKQFLNIFLNHKYDSKKFQAENCFSQKVS